MRLKHSFLISLTALLIFSCQKETTDIEDLPVVDLPVINEDAVRQGIIRVKFRPETGGDIEMSLASATDGDLTTGISLLDTLILDMKIMSLERTFPYAGRFEARTRDEGLHLWYDIHFEETTSVTKAAKGFYTIPGVDIIEPLPEIVLVDTGAPIFLSDEEIREIVSVNTQRADNDDFSDYPFNDPLLPSQWHYYNTGAMSLAVEGADINLIPAWKKQKGSPEVIVAIVDGGLQYRHEDLQQNYYINLAELNGIAGRDDDNNGYIDDVYGWNFVDNNTAVSGHNHGMHVAGVVAAVNNNGKGVSGIAGGDGINPGVRVLSCQIFRANPEDPSKNLTGNSAAAIKYGADCGAVISQNSWSHDGDMVASIKEAIDYFIKYAGFDEHGVQTGPMAGGVVVFSSGNDNSSQLRYPPAYSEVIAVSSMAPDYKRAYYSNYGTWVGITAPGGAADYGESYMVLSTLPEGGYGYMQGTSMACPHVSGIAALVVSEFGVGQPGYTSTMLKEKILASINNINIYNPSLAGRLGSGYIDAAKAVFTDNNIAPDKVNDLSVSCQSNSIDLNWSVTVGSDNIKASSYYIYVNDTEFSDVNEINALMKVKVTPGMNPGYLLSATIPDLKDLTTYYIAVVGADIYNNLSEYDVVTGSTTKNYPPEVIMDPLVSFIELQPFETGSYTYRVSDHEGFSWTVQYKGDNPAISIVRDSGQDRFTIKIYAPYTTLGIYNEKFEVTDKYGATTILNLSFSIMKNNPPIKLKEIGDMYFGSFGVTKVIDLAAYFADDDGDRLNYNTTLSQEGVVMAVRSGTELSLTSIRSGTINATVTVSDHANATVSSTFSILIRDGSTPVDLYPNPVEDKLNIRMGEEVDGVANIKLYNSTGIEVFNNEVTIRPTTPGVIDIKNLSSGYYTVSIAYNGKEVKSSIIKK